MSAILSGHHLPLLLWGFMTGCVAPASLSDGRKAISNDGSHPFSPTRLLRVRVTPERMAQFANEMPTVTTHWSREGHKAGPQQHRGKSPTPGPPPAPWDLESSRLGGDGRRGSWLIKARNVISEAELLMVISLQLRPQISLVWLISALLSPLPQRGLPQLPRGPPLPFAFSDLLTQATPSGEWAGSQRGPVHSPRLISHHQPCPALPCPGTGPRPEIKSLLRVDG